MHFSEYDTRLAAYAVLLDDQERMLLTWWNGEGKGTPAWSLPGGGVEYEETLEEAVVREVHEETGYTVEVGVPLATSSFTAPPREAGDRPYKSQRVVFAATIVGGDLGTTEVGGSTDYAEWVPLAAVPGLPSKADIVDVAYAACIRRLKPLA